MKFYLLGLLIVLSACSPAANRGSKLPPIDVPGTVKLGFVSGMTVRIMADQTFKILIYGEKEAHGGIRLTPLSFGPVDPNGETRISEETEVTVERPRAPVSLRCYRGVLGCDSIKRSVQIELEVKDEGVWHPFGWNGKWPLIVGDSEDKK